MSDGQGMVQAINFLIEKRRVNIFTFGDLQNTVNSPDDLNRAKTQFKKYFTLDENL